MDSHWISFAALIVSAAALGLNVVIYRNSKRKADEGRIVELEMSVGKKITTLGETIGKNIADFREEVEGHRTEFEGRLDGHVEQIAKLEKGAGDAPTHDDLGRLHEKINDVGKGVSHLAGEMTGVKNLLNTINEHLLRGGK
ncbi:MAG: hypothetical protein Q7U97_14210 [Rhodocyclaceae bacterium]|nr:hypothetical protein [Rhodocyclaceae bacterium]